MPFIEKTAYKGAVRLVADDYFFEVVSDLIINVTGNLSFERGDVKNMVIKSTVGETDKVNESPAKKQTSINTKVQRVETPAEIAKRLMNEGQKPAAKKEIPTFNMSTGRKPSTDSRIERKGIPASLKETLTDGKDALIEEEVSDFVSAEKSAKEAKLREILKNFTIDPNASPSRARFTRKT